MSAHVIQRPSTGRRLGWSLVPLALVVAAAIVANTGFGIARDANAATSSVVVNATVAATASTVSNCGTLTFGSILGATVTSATNNVSCTVTFGSTNASGITLTGVDAAPATNFWTQGASNFADAGAGACAAMSVAADTIGYKLTGGTATKNLCAGVTSAANVNPNWSGVPKAPATLCTSTALGTQTCVIAFGVNEVGSNAPAASYSGQMDLTSS
jgi:hypothetical protein